MSVPRLTEPEAALAVLNVFVRYRIKAAGFLRRTHFFEMRDDDFVRGLAEALRRGWLRLPPHRSQTYVYFLTEDGYAEGYRMESVDK